MPTAALTLAAATPAADPVAVLQPVLLLLLAGVLAIVVSKRLRLSPVVGFLVAGAALGHGGFDLVPESGVTHLLAELGVVLLLFDIGLHFSLSHLWAARREVFGLGPLQVVLCGVVTGGLLLLLGVPGIPAVLGGIALALSSTAVVSQVIAERRMSASPVTRAALSVLVVQDLAAIAALVLLASLDANAQSGVGETGLAAPVALAALKAAAAFGVALLLRRFAVLPLFGVLARTRQDEVLTGAALLTVLAAATLTHHIGLSLTLGSFLVGMMLADTPVQHQVSSEIKPFRGLLLGFFFLSIGMSLNPWGILTSLHWVLLILAVLLAVKAAGVYAAARLTRFERPQSVRLAFLLSEGSEFAFVVLAAAPVAAALGDTLRSGLVSAIAVSLAITPWLTERGCRLATKLSANEQSARGLRPTPNETTPPTPELKAPSVVLHLDRVGRRVANALTAHDIPYVVVDDDYERFAQGLSEGFPMVYGDVADLNFAQTIGMDDRPMVIVSHLRLDVARDITPGINCRFPNLTRLAAARTEEERDAYAAVGGVPVLLRTPPDGVELAAEALRRHGVPEADVAAWTAKQQQTLTPAAAG